MENIALLNDDVLFVICLKLPPRLASILSKIMRDKYFTRYKICINLDKHPIRIDEDNFNFIQKYGMDIDLGMLKYQKTEDYREGYRNLTISTEYLLKKFLTMFDNSVIKRYSQEEIVSTVKIIRSKTIVIVREFAKVFPEAELYGPIDFNEENLEFMEKNYKKNHCLYFTLSNTKVDYVDLAIYKLDSVDAVTGEYLYDVIKISTDSLSEDGRAYDKLEEIIVMHDNMEKLLDYKLALPSLRSLNFSIGYKEYNLLGDILKKYPTISDIRNFTIYTSEHIDTYIKFRHLISHIHICPVMLGVWTNDNSNIFILLNRLMDIEYKNMDNYPMKNLILYDEILPQDVRNRTYKYYNINYEFIREDFIRHINNRILFEKLNDVGIKINIKINQAILYSKLVLLAEKIVKLFDTKKLYYEIDGLIGNLDIENEEQNEYRNKLLSISCHFPYR